MKAIPMVEQRRFITQWEWMASVPDILSRFNKKHSAQPAKRRGKP